MTPPASTARSRSPRTVTARRRRSTSRPGRRIRDRSPSTAIAPGATCTIDEPVDGSTAAVAVATSPESALHGRALPGRRHAGHHHHRPLHAPHRPAARRQACRRPGRRLSRGHHHRRSTAPTAQRPRSPTRPTDPLAALDVGPVPFGTTCTITEPSTGATGRRHRRRTRLRSRRSRHHRRIRRDRDGDQHLPLRSRHGRTGQGVGGPGRRRPGTVRLRWTCNDEVTVFEIPPE